MSLKDILSPFNAWKRAFEKPDTIVRPLSTREGAPLYRGFHVNDVDQCIGCGSCEEICQNAAIDLVEAAACRTKPGDSGLRPLIDYGRCCWCALCVDVCPTGSLAMSNEYVWISENPDDFRFVPGIDDKKWNRSPQGYRRPQGAWLVGAEREPMPEREPESRKRDFSEYAAGYSDEQASAEAGRCLECGICVQACPTHMDVPRYIRAIRENDLEEGLRVMYETNPMLEACGRVCTAECEDACAVGRGGDPIAIRSLKRYIGDRTSRDKDAIMDLPAVEQTGKKVGIVGGGPAGLTAAFYLCRLGHAVTIYEKHGRLGGMLKWGIPDYRLPADVLQREIDFILRQGVDVKYSTEVGKDLSLAQLHRDNDAVFIGIGAQVGSDMLIEGTNEEGVYSGVEFLEKVARGERPYVGKEAVIVGGGNTAMDATRSSIRLGAEVKIVYRRSEKEMPAHREEVREAREEGAELMILTTPTRIEKLASGRLRIECLKMELGEPDGSGRRRPVPKEGSEFHIEADVCIMAVGQKVEPGLSKELGLKLTKWGTFEVQSDTLQSDEKVYAGGDCQTGPDAAVRAVAAGKKAAYFIDRQLRG